jgi:hypothetical protein
MQATVTPTAQVSRTLLATLVLLAGLILGAVGGYFINDLTRATTSASLSQTSSPGSDYALSMARHAASERAEANPYTAADFALSVARHSAEERAEADSASVSTLAQSLARFRVGERAAANPLASSTP